MNDRSCRCNHSVTWRHTTASSITIVVTHYTTFLPKCVCMCVRLCVYVRALVCVCACMRVERLSLFKYNVINALERYTECMQMTWVQRNVHIILHYRSVVFFLVTLPSILMHLWCHFIASIYEFIMTIVCDGIWIYNDYIALLLSTTHRQHLPARGDPCYGIPRQVASYERVLNQPDRLPMAAYNPTQRKQQTSKATDGGHPQIMQISTWLW